MDEHVEELICKVVDGCASPDEVEEVERMAAQDPEIRKELQAQQEAVSAIGSVGLRELQDDIAEQYWGGVYNRLERKSGWLLVAIGFGLVVVYSIYELLKDPTIHTVYRIGIAALIVGFGLVFSGVFRMRRKLRRHDKYEEILR